MSVPANGARIFSCASAAVRPEPETTSERVARAAFATLDGDRGGRRVGRGRLGGRLLTAGGERQGEQDEEFFQGVLQRRATASATR